MAKMSKNELRAKLAELGISFKPSDSREHLESLLPDGWESMEPVSEEPKEVKMKKVKVDRKPKSVACGLAATHDHEKRITALENEVLGQVEIEVPA